MAIVVDSSSPTPADPQTPAMRLLINDTATDPAEQLFSDGDLAAFLTIEGGNLKRAAAQAIDTIADNEALVSKVIRDKDVATDGAKVADALRKRAAALRAQADKDDDQADEGFFEIVEFPQPGSRSELTNPYHSGIYW